MKALNFNKILIVSSIFILFLFLLLNIYTPLFVDDYFMSVGIHSISDIIISQYNFYFSWGGAIVAGLFQRFWLLVGKPFFNIANTLIYCIFIFSIQFHITGRLKKPNPGFFLIMSIFFWFIQPDWGQVFLWLVGSWYLWAAVIILLFLVPFRKRQDNPAYKLNIPLSVLYFPIGIITGLSSVNGGAALLFLLIAYITVKIVRKDKFTLFEILGAIGFFIGFSLMLAAPGNNARAEAHREEGLGIFNDPFLVKYILRFIESTGRFIENQSFLLISISAILGFDHIYHRKRKLHVFSYFYALAALASVYSMLLSPLQSHRAFFIALVFSVITLGNVLVQIEFQLPNIIKKYAAVFFIIVLIPLAWSFFFTGRAFLVYYLRWYDRMEYILAEKEKGNFEIETRPITSTEKHMVSSSVSGDVLLASYFNVESITTNDNSPAESLWLDKRKRIRQLYTPPWKIIKRIREIKQ
jgi:hypothetical protein